MQFTSPSPKFNRRSVLVTDINDLSLTDGYYRINKPCANLPMFIAYEQDITERYILIQETVVIAGTSFKHQKIIGRSYTYAVPQSTIYAERFHNGTAWDEWRSDATWWDYITPVPFWTTAPSGFLMFRRNGRLVEVKGAIQCIFTFSPANPVFTIPNFKGFGSTYCPAQAQLILSNDGNLCARVNVTSNGVCYLEKAANWEAGNLCFFNFSVTENIFN